MIWSNEQRLALTMDIWNKSYPKLLSSALREADELLSKIDATAPKEEMPAPPFWTAEALKTEGARLERQKWEKAISQYFGGDGVLSRILAIRDNPEVKP